MIVMLTLSGCQSVYAPKRANVKGEGSLVFVRPKKYSLIGTKSLRDYCEVVYEKFTINDAGQPVVKFALRNRGGKHWYNTKAPSITISAKAVFYEDPVGAQGPDSPPTYETNWQRLPMTRGETIHYSFTSPVAADGYQVTLSDAL